MSDDDFKRTELAIQTLRHAMQQIAQYSDCLYDDEGLGEGPKNCNCPVHVAKRALATEEQLDWRFDSYLAYRRNSMPRELAIVEAWKAYLKRKPGQGSPDSTMSAIIGDEPSVRDWYVATSVIQWLATNCGMSVLDAAGFKYDWQGRK